MLWYITTWDKQQGAQNLMNRMGQDTQGGAGGQIDTVYVYCSFKKKKKTRVSPCFFFFFKKKKKKKRKIFFVVIAKKKKKKLNKFFFKV